jgi:hypothetical protein
MQKPATRYVLQCKIKTTTLFSGTTKRFCVEFLLNHMQLVMMTLTGVVVVLAVLLHFEALSFLTTFLPSLKIKSRMRLIILMFGLLTVHLIEIWLFAFAYFFFSHNPTFGHIQGPMHELLDYAYYSAVTYSSLGFGDMIPVGPIRFMTAMEALTGLMMIGWSASFMYIEMKRFWKRD